jgi:hypothetical protein
MLHVPPIFVLFYFIGIITIGKTALLEPQPSLEDCVRLHPVFTSLDFPTIFFLKEQGDQPCVPTLNLKDEVPVLMSPQ